MATEIETIKSRKSNSQYIVSEENGRGYLVCTGEASTNQKVIKQCEMVRRSRHDVPTTLWIARQLSNTY